MSFAGSYICSGVALFFRCITVYKHPPPSLHSLHSTLLIKRSAKRLFANSSRQRQRIETKLSQPLDAIPDLDLRGSACANKLPPRSARRKTFNLPSAILDLRRKYTVFCARSYVCNAKEEPQWLFANSSRERRRIATKLSQPSNTIPDLGLRGSLCVNKLLPRSGRRRNQPSAILDFRPWFAEER